MIFNSKGPWKDCHLIENTYERTSFPSASDGKESACNAGDSDSIPGLGRSPGEGNGNPLQYSCLENPMHRGPWWATVHAVAKRQKWLKWLTLSLSFMKGHIIHEAQMTGNQLVSGSAKQFIKYSLTTWVLPFSNVTDMYWFPPTTTYMYTSDMQMTPPLWQKGKRN